MRQPDEPADPATRDARSIGEYLISSRSFAEYQAMFALTDADLAGRVLDCPGGGASFTAGLCGRGGDALAVDPAYSMPAADFIRRLDGELGRGGAWTRTHAQRYVWNFYGDPDRHAHMREDSARVFGEDLLRHPNRYQAAALPALPFPDGTFDLVLSSHLLFTYADRLDADFHLAALREMARVSRGRVRVYPLVDQAGQPLPDLLEHLIAQLTADGLAPHLVDVDYEFQRGATAMLELHTHSPIPPGTSSAGSATRPDEDRSMTTADEPLTYRLLTGSDDAAFCARVSQALAEGYRLHGSPLITFDGQRVITAHAEVRAGRADPNVVLRS